MKRKNVQTRESYQLATLRKRNPLTTNHQIEREYCDLFWEVVREFNGLGFSEPVVSSHADPAGCNKNRAAAIADFIIAVESATQRALQGTGLIGDWLRLARENIRPPRGVLKKIIRLCAPMYRKRRLSPDRFFPSPRRTGARRYSVRPPRAKNILNQTHHRHSKAGKSRYYCEHEQHGLQTVTKCIKDDAGEILKLQCGCSRRMDAVAAVPVRGTVVSIDALRAAASPSNGDSASMERSTAA